MSDVTATPPVVRASATSFPKREPWGKVGVALLVLALIVGGALRLYDLGGPSFSDDEIFKVNAVNSYRAGQWTVTGDDEHPLAMKLLIYASYGVRDLWNTHVAGDNKVLEVGIESATRMPNALVGTFIALLLAFLGRELFSRRIGLIAALLWAVEVNVIGYNRIAKEDTLLTFFLLLTLYFVVRAKRMSEASDEKRAWRYQVAAALSIGGFAATKYFIHLLFIVPLFYAFSRWAARKAAKRGDVTEAALPVWRIPLKRWFALLGIAVVTALAINPTVLHPGNLEYIAGYIAHKTVFTHGYLFQGDLYMNNVFETFTGTPWYFYFTYLGVKVALPILVMIGLGLGIAVAKRRDDGPRMIFIWLAIWLTIHAILSGAKWGRFVTHLMPPVLLLAAVGVDGAAKWLAAIIARARRASTQRQVGRIGGLVAAGVGTLVWVGALAAPLQTAPHYRMYLNAAGGDEQNLRHYFPHCDFYDVGLREAVQYVCARAEENAQLRNDAPEAVAHYVKMCGRADIKVTTLSKPGDQCEPGRACYQILQVGRTFYETANLFASLHSARPPDAIVRARGVNVAEIYGPMVGVPSLPEQPGERSVAASILTAGEAVRLGALARVFGNTPKGEMVSKLPDLQPARPEHTGPHRIAAVTTAIRFAGDVVVEELDTRRAPATDSLLKVQ